MTPERRREGAGRRVSGAERRGLGVVDREHLGESGDAEDLQQPVLGADQLHRAVVGADLLQASDEDAEPGGVEEVDALHVDDELVVALADELGDLVAELRGRVDVDLPTDGDNRTTVHLAGLQRKIHGLSSEPGPTRSPTPTLPRLFKMY